MRNWLKSLLFVSAFSPALLALAGVRYYSKGLDTVFYQLVVIALIGIILPFLILSLIRKKAEIINFKAKKVESADYLLLVFIGSYIAPIIMKVAEINFEITAIIVLILFFVAWIISYIPTHPLLYIAKFRFYKVESDTGMVYVLMARRIIRSPKSIKEVKQISNSMLME
ncbi:hypothetical protein [Desulfobacter postgatei]|uniref:Uncharacterized protein n=1 Tax=Desulfobacter postgatei 2ac9 TaxID=879212 RepID=I5AZZ5_9BACT|nr:hypothetical protein [Desulfobacter postgatei]EIM62808.1 hypothetical protein DespoDRAFT_00824 [Desulfobacter postgatei 2ac9]